MSTVIGVFSDSERAGKAIGELKNAGFTNDISVVARDVNSPGLEDHDIKKNLADGAAAGATTGAVLGAIGAVLVGAASFVVPGVGFVVLGPLATLLAGTAAGAATGGIVGALVDLGIPDAKAKEYEHHVDSGDVLVAVTAESGKSEEVRSVLNSYGATDVDVADR
jgi:uncharacterized membrane protein